MWWFWDDNNFYGISRSFQWNLMKALHELICQIHNNRKAPNLQADVKIWTNTMARMCQNSSHAALSTSGISQQEARLRLRCTPTQGLRAAAVNHLCFTTTHICCCTTVYSCKKYKLGFTLSQGISSAKYLWHSKDAGGVPGVGRGGKRGS